MKSMAVFFCVCGCVFILCRIIYRMIKIFPVAVYFTVKAFLKDANLDY